MQRTRQVPRTYTLVPSLIGLAVLATVPAWADSYVLTVLSLAGIYYIATLGLNLLVGYTGQLSFGHNAFAAVGGYTSAILTTRYMWDPIGAMVAGVAVSLMTALFVGWPTLRLRGHYLAMATLALGLAVYHIAVQWEALTYGFMGIAGIPPITVLGRSTDDPVAFYILVWVLAVLGFIFMVRFVESREGLALKAIRDDEGAATSLGIDAARYKLTSFCISAVYASISGSLYAHFATYISPEAYGMYMTLLLFTMVFIGGVAQLGGPLFGAVTVIVLPELLRPVYEYREILYGAALLAMLLFAPSGLNAALVDLVQRWVQRSAMPRRGAMEEKTL